MKSAVCIRISVNLGSSNGSVKILTVVTVPHLHKSSEFTSEPCICEVEFFAVLPVNIVKAVDIGHIDLLIICTCHTGKLIMLLCINQKLVTCDPDYESVCSGLSLGIVAVIYGKLLCLDINDLG